MVVFRSRSWIDEEILSLLREHGVAWCINDWQDMPSVPEVTANFAYLRWTGYHDRFVYLGKVQDERMADLQPYAETGPRTSGERRDPRQRGDGDPAPVRLAASQGSGESVSLRCNIIGVPGITNCIACGR